MAPVGTVIPGRRSTAPTVPRVGGTGMAARVGRPSGSARQPSPAFPWRGDRSPFGHGTHPGAGQTGFLLPHGGMLLFEMARVFPIPDQKATTVARKLVYEIVARYGAF